MLAVIGEMLETIPKPLDYGAIAQKKSTDMSPLNVNLLQEIERYNALLGTLSLTLQRLRKGIN